MKKLLSILAAMMLMLSVGAFAQEQETLDSAGTTPDSMFYFMDVASDNIALAMTFNTDKKIEKHLQIANERLAEAELMAEKGELKALEKAEKQHGKAFAKLKDDMQKVEDSNSTEKLEKEIRIQERVETHRSSVNGLEVSIQSRQDLTAEQKEQLLAFISSLKGQTGEVEIEIENEQARTKIKIKQETGGSDDDVSEIENEIRGRGRGEGRSGDDSPRSDDSQGGATLVLSGMDVKAETEAGRTLVKVELRYDSDKTGEALAAEIMDKFSLDATTASQALKLQPGVIGNDTDRLRIEVKDDKGQNEVRVELRFLTSSVDRAAIAAEIAQKTLLDKTKVDTAITSGRFREGLSNDDDDDFDDNGAGETEFEVDIRGSVATVEVKERGVVLETFTVASSDRATIIAEIASKKGMTTAQVESLIEFSLEDENDEDESGDDNGVSGRDRPRTGGSGGSTDD